MSNHAATIVDAALELAETATNLPFLVEVRRGSVMVRVSVWIDGSSTAHPPCAVEPDVLSQLEQDILRVATAEPQTAKRLAGLLGKEAKTYFRDGLRSLVRRDLLRHGPDGYWRPEAPSPA